MQSQFVELQKYISQKSIKKGDAGFIDVKWDNFFFFEYNM